MGAVKGIDWSKWLPFALTVAVMIVTNVATLTWFAASTSFQVEAAQTKISEIRNSDIVSVRREFQALASKVDSNEGSRLSMNDRLIRIEEQLRFTTQTVDRIEKLLTKGQ